MAKERQRIEANGIGEVANEIMSAEIVEVGNRQTLAGYDYGALPADVAKAARSAAKDIRRRVQETTRNLVEIGERLIVVRDSLPHGQWLPWLEAEFEWTSRTANNFIHVAEAFRGDKLEIISNLRLPPTAVMHLATAPDNALNIVVERAQAGERLTVAAVQQVIRDARQAPPEPLPIDPWEGVIDWDETLIEGPSDGAIINLSADQVEALKSLVEAPAPPPPFKMSFTADFRNATEDQWYRSAAQLYEDIRSLASEVIIRMEWCESYSRPLPKIWRTTMPPRVDKILSHARALAGGTDDGVMALRAEGRLAEIFNVLTDFRRACQIGEAREALNWSVMDSIRKRFEALEFKE